MSTRVIGRINSNPPGYLIVGAPNGVAGLDADGKLPSGQEPEGAVLSVAAVQTSAYTSVGNEIVPADATSAGFTVKLPSAPADGSRVCVKKIDATANAVTIACQGSDVLNKTGGSTSATLTLTNQAVMLQYKTTSAIWYVTGDDLPLSSLNGVYSTLPTATPAVAVVNDPRFVADGVTDNGAVFAALSASGEGGIVLPKGVVLSGRPVVWPRRTQLRGQGRDGAPYGTTVKFDKTKIMAGGIAATVAANGSTWTFTVGSGHGVSGGDTIDAMGFTTAGFNGYGQLVASVTATTIVVTNATVPAASDTGKLNPNRASVAANGTNWTFTVYAGHGLQAGDTFATSGFATAAFNKFVNIIASVTATTLVVANTTVPAASDKGKVNVHLFHGGAIGQNSPGCLIQDVLIDCSDIPGGCGYYSNVIQEDSGLTRTQVTGAVYRGVVIDGSGDSGNGLSPLNYTADRIQTRASAYNDPEYVGADEYAAGGAGQGGIRNFTGTNGNGTIKAQLRFNNSGGFRFGIHVESAVDGVLIGDLKACAQLTVDGVKGHSSVTNTVRIATSAVGTNGAIEVRDIKRNSATNGLVDTPNSKTVAADIGSYRTTTAGGPPIVDPDAGTVAIALTTASATVAGNPTLPAASATDVITTASLATGTWLVSVQLCIVNGSGAAEMEAQLYAGTATASFNGPSGAESWANSATVVELNIRCLVTVTVAGTLKVKVYNNNATNQALLRGSSNGTGAYANISGYTAVKVA